jgi:hypothetical protein
MLPPRNRFRLLVLSLALSFLGFFSAMVAGRLIGALFDGVPIHSALSVSSLRELVLLSLLIQPILVVGTWASIRFCGKH